MRVRTNFATITHRVLLLPFVLLIAILGLAQSNDPRFESYPADVLHAKDIRLNLRSNRLARHYRTSLRRQINEEGINFAGHYSLVAVGCGTGCSVTAIVDARNGTAHFPAMLNGWTGIVGDYEIPEGEDVRMFKADSRLLRAVGRPRIGTLEEERYGPSGIYYYEWTKNHLRLVKFVHVGSYPEADPPRGTNK